MAFGRKSDSHEDDAKEKALRDQAKSEAWEIKKAEREAKAKQRIADKKVREDAKIAKEKGELELYGRKVLEEVCAMKTVRIYDKGFVRVSGLFQKDRALFEKLRAISSSADVTKKSGLGRSVAAVMTFGLNTYSPNKRGDLYLTITTDKTTHMIHVSPPTERDMKSMHKIATAGQGVLDSIERLIPEQKSSNSSIQSASFQASAPPSTVIDELTKLVALRDAGALSEDEFSAMKKKLMA